MNDLKLIGRGVSILLALTIYAFLWFFTIGVLKDDWTEVYEEVIASAFLILNAFALVVFMVWSWT